MRPVVWTLILAARIRRGYRPGHSYGFRRASCASQRHTLLRQRKPRSIDRWTAAAARLRREDMVGPLRTLKDIARKVGKLMQECKLDLDLEEYVDSFQTGLVDATRAWCRGAKFAEV